jgi:hypothetical protein
VHSVRPAVPCSFVDSLVSVLRHHRLAGELGVGADQRELPVDAGLPHDLGHGLLQVTERAERPLGQRRLGDPGRMLIEAVQQAGRLGRRSRR